MRIPQMEFDCKRISQKFFRTIYIQFNVHNGNQRINTLSINFQFNGQLFRILGAQAKRD